MNAHRMAAHDRRRLTRALEDDEAWLYLSETRFLRSLLDWARQDRPLTDNQRKAFEEILGHVRRRQSARTVPGGGAAGR